MAGNLRFPRINSVTLSARLTRDPELRRTPNGDAVMNLPLAFDRAYKDKNSGEFVKIPGYIDAVVWRYLAEKCEAQLRKGSPVVVEGTIETRSYENKEGRNVKIVEINASKVHFLEWDESNRGDDYGNRGEQRDERGSQDNRDVKPDVTDDDVPF
ncbi:MAG: single-stranded DNA-binding protein [Candidatus Cloacimonetes bacterium]|nr:single-stranded DNA-binding protein [Candidatus Cloacimonadota bacterium]